MSSFERASCLGQPFQNVSPSEFSAETRTMGRSTLEDAGWARRTSKQPDGISLSPAFEVHKYCHRTWRTTEGGEAFSRENAIIDHLSWCSILGVDSGIMAFILSVGHPLEGNGAISPWTSQMAHSDDRSLPLHTLPHLIYTQTCYSTWGSWS